MVKINNGEEKKTRIFTLQNGEIKMERDTLTFVCLILTIVVLCGTIGADKLGTPEQDLNEIRQQLYSRGQRVKPHSVLEEVQSIENNNDNNNYAPFDISKILKDKEIGDDEKHNPNTPYTLGLEISDWDEQCSSWMNIMLVLILILLILISNMFF